MSDQAKTPKAVEISKEVKKSIKDSKDKPVSRLKEAMIESELKQQEELLKKGFEKRAELKKSFNSIKPKQRHVREIEDPKTGEKKRTTERTYSPEESEEMDKLEKQMDKLDKALDKAIDEGDYGDLKGQVK